MGCPSSAPVQARAARVADLFVRRTRRLAPVPWLASLLLLGGAGCGGAASEQPPLGAPASAAADSSEDEELTSGATQREPESRCSDGSCFECGSGLCPAGFYCDEDAVGGAACSWLPSCPQEPSCACVTRALGAGCRCEERAGGLHVSCS